MKPGRGERAFFWLACSWNLCGAAGCATTIPVHPDAPAAEVSRSYDALLALSKPSGEPATREPPSQQDRTSDGKLILPPPASGTDEVELAPNTGEGYWTLAQRYEAGRGVPAGLTRATGCAYSAAIRKVAAAEQWLVARSEQGDPYASFEVARLQQNRTLPAASASFDRALGLLRAAASADQLEANYWLGLAYQDGRGVERDLSAAREWFLRGAGRGEAEAQNALGDLLRVGGDGVRKDAVGALLWYKRAADQGHPWGEYGYGHALYFGHGVGADPAAAAGWLWKAAARGLPAAQHVLGHLYESGEGVPKDPSVAAAWYRKATQQGYGPAQVELGDLFATGVGVAEDQGAAAALYQLAADQGDVRGQRLLCLHDLEGKAGRPEQALPWCRKAAEQGDPSGQYHLGYIFDEGIGTKRDPAQALFWYRKAAEQGDSFAQNNLGRKLKIGDGVARDLAAALVWYEKSAAQDNPTAQFNLGVMYETGEGVPKDEAQAAVWYGRAADHGNASAQANLGLLLSTGRGVARDDVAAARLYELAARQGVALAQNGLGFAFEYGTGVTQSDAQAVFWYRKAAEQGYAFAFYNLGRFAERGRGMPQDDGAALGWYQQAQKAGHKTAGAARTALQARMACRRGARTQLFGVLVRCASRDELRGAVARLGAAATREDLNYWYDEYESSALLQGSTKLSLGYLDDGNVFARAEYEFQSHLDINQVQRVAEMIVSKYGLPKEKRGNVSVGPVSYSWMLPDGLLVRVWRGWPSTTTYLEYVHPQHRAQLEKEIALNEARQKATSFQSQSSAF